MFYYTWNENATSIGDYIFFFLFLLIILSSQNTPENRHTLFRVSLLLLVLLGVWYLARVIGIFTDPQDVYDDITVTGGLLLVIYSMPSIVITISKIISIAKGDELDMQNRELYEKQKAEEIVRKAEFESLPKPSLSEQKLERQKERQKERQIQHHLRKNRLAIQRYGKPFDKLTSVQKEKLKK